MRPEKPVLLHPFFAGLVALARRSDPIPSRTRPSNALAPMVLCLKTWESRSSPGLQRTDNLPLHEKKAFGPIATRLRLFDAGWSSPVARQAHNLKAAGSNPAPATKPKPLKPFVFRGLFCGYARDGSLAVEASWKRPAEGCSVALAASKCCFRGNVKAQPRQGWGRGFESLRPLQISLEKSEG